MTNRQPYLSKAVAVQRKVKKHRRQHEFNLLRDEKSLVCVSDVCEVIIVQIVLIGVVQVVLIGLGLTANAAPAEC
jgi:hypothetical protein